MLCICDSNVINEMCDLLKNDLNYHKLILTTNNEKFVLFNNINYSLFKINTIFRKVELDDIMNSSIFVSYDNSNEIVNKWINLWSDHIDYIEYQIDEYKTKYPYLEKIIYYYIGMAENSIQLLKSSNINSINKYIAHKRIGTSTNLVELYNPCYTTIDTRVRDIAEYFKNIFFYSDEEKNSLYLKINYCLQMLDNNEKILFFIRMLYPSYFFDIYDDIILNKKENSILSQITSKNVEYERFLKNILNEIKKTTYIDNIDWLV